MHDYHQSAPATPDDLQAAIDSIPLGVVMLRHDGFVVLLNRAARTVLGYRPGHLHPLRGADMFPVLKQVLDGTYVVSPDESFNMNVIRADGALVRCRSWAMVHGNDSLGLTCVFFDVSDELRDRELDRVESLNRMSGLLIDAAMHEVRNLSAAALLVLDQIEAGAREADLRSSPVHAAATLLRRVHLVASEGVLAASGHNAPCCDTVDLIPPLEDAHTIANAVCSTCGIRLVWDVPACLPEVFGDCDSILQILLNLLRNSVRAVADCDERTIAVHAVEAPSDRIAIRVQDSGPGVAHPETLFRPYRTGGETHGIGLGLFISKALAQACGGDLQYEAVPRGASFRLDLRRSGVGGNRPWRTPAS